MEEALLDNSIQPIQQFAYTQGKNSTDSAMIIDAMDLLYSNRFDGFCLVSSDSDFTRLASRIREAGLVVYGLGERKAPKSFVSACDKYIYLDNISPEPKPVQGSLVIQGGRPISTEVPRAIRSDVPWMQIFKCIADSSDDEGWANLAAVGNLMGKRSPDFDSRTYGFEKLRLLLKSNRELEFESREPSHGRGPPISYTRLRTLV